MNKLHQEDVRSKIKASLLVKVLQDHALDGGELSPTRMKAIEILLRKSLADLSSIELVGDADHPVAFEVVAPWLKPSIQSRN